MRTGWTALLGVFMLATGVGCTSEAPAPAEWTTLSSPAEGPSGQPRLQTGPDGRLWLSWVAALGDDRHALRYATRRDTAWGAPTTVARGTDWFVNWADLPSVRPLPDGRIAAHYLESNGPSPLAYAVRITQSTRGGDGHAPVTPHGDTPTEHGFVSLLPGPGDRLLAVWLDGRRLAGGGHGGGGDMTLRAALIDSTGAVVRRDRLDARTCECCATSAVRVGDEALVAYRDRSADEVRDIALVRFDGTEWSAPTRLHADGWRLEGCPVNGPALAARGEQVAAAWFTAADGRPRVKAALSTDGGRRFAEPVVVAEGQAKGRVDVVLLDDGTAVVSWLGTQGTQGRVRARAVTRDGRTGAPTTIAPLPSAARRVGFPRLARQADRLYAAWVAPDPDPGRVVLRSAPVSAVRPRP